MVQIGPVKYSKEEEHVLARAFLLGVSLGIPLGILINYLTGFPIIHTQAPNDFYGWTTLFFTFFMSFLTLPIILTMIFFVLFWRKNEKLHLQTLKKAFWSVLVFLFFLPSYVTITYSGLIAVLGEGVATLFSTLFTLLITPFVILFLAIFIPESRPGAVLYRFIRRLRKRNKQESKY
jgi:L-cystine uptake protein TcyP (sodium:dicarboxylate symporter family)